MEEADHASKLTVSAPPILPRSSPIQVEDPMTPRVSSSDFGVSSPRTHLGASSSSTAAVVVTPVAAPPAVRRIEIPPSIPRFTLQDETMSEAEEARDAAVLLTALSAIATKEVHVDGVTDLLGLSAEKKTKKAAVPVAPPPFPDLGLLSPADRGLAASTSTFGEFAKRCVDAAEGLRTAVSNAEGAAAAATEILVSHHHQSSPRQFEPQQESSSNNNRVRAVSIEAAPEASSDPTAFVMGVASDLSLPCEPCYDEEGGGQEGIMGESEAKRSLPILAQFQGAGLAIAPTLNSGVGGGGAALVSPPASPAARPRARSNSAYAGNGGGCSSPRSADRRKRYLDLHGAPDLLDLPPASSCSPSAPPSRATSNRSEGASSSSPALPSGPGVGGGLVGDLGPHHKGVLQPTEALRGRLVRTIMRKKFSWKNYPELERFLIANREEYLRHSALNYTVQQKRYNNRLTDRLLQLATEHGYVFDESDFSFVTVRDRIRCYFKSYVQSSKKRGLVVGYAARRAGLLSRDELEKSAGTAGRIFLPGEEQRAEA